MNNPLKRVALYTTVATGGLLLTFAGLGWFSSTQKPGRDSKLDTQTSSIPRIAWAFGIARSHVEMADKKAEEEADLKDYAIFVVKLHDIPRPAAVQIAAAFHIEEDEFNKFEDSEESYFASIADRYPSVARAMIEAERNPVVQCEEGGFAVQDHCYNSVVQYPDGHWDTRKPVSESGAQIGPPLTAPKNHIPSSR